MIEGLKSEADGRWLGGGLVRSMGGWKEVMERRREGEKWQSDERILGDGEFVEKVLQEANEKLDKIEERKRKGWNLERLRKEVAKIFDIEESAVTERSRTRKIVMAKGVFSYYAHVGLGGKEPRLQDC